MNSIPSGEQTAKAGSFARGVLFKNMTNLTAQFKAYLIANHLSSVSVKNYVSDINKFLNWVSTVPSNPSHSERSRGIFNNYLDSKDPSTSLRMTKNNTTLPTQEDFKNYYNKINQSSAPSQTIKRYQSALRKFGQFLKEEYVLSKNPAEITRDAIYGVSTQQINPEKMLDAYRKSLEKAQAKPATIRNYLADTRQFLNWLTNI